MIGVVMDKDIDILEYTKNIRIDLINHITSNGTMYPKSSKDVEALNEVLNSLDKQVIDMKKIELKDKEVKNEQALKESISEIYKSISNRDHVRTIDINIDSKHIPNDIVNKEDHLGKDDIDKTKFT